MAGAVIERREAMAGEKRRPPETPILKERKEVMAKKSKKPKLKTFSSTEVRDSLFPDGAEGIASEPAEDPKTPKTPILKERKEVMAKKSKKPKLKTFSSTEVREGLFQDDEVGMASETDSSSGKFCHDHSWVQSKCFLHKHLIRAENHCFKTMSGTF